MWPPRKSRGEEKEEKLEQIGLNARKKGKKENLGKIAKKNE